MLGLRVDMDLGPQRGFRNYQRSTQSDADLLLWEILGFRVSRIRRLRVSGAVFEVCGLKSLRIGRVQVATWRVNNGDCEGYYMGYRGY